jgi:hypothetical protein
VSDQFERHIDDESLEQFVFGRLAEACTESLEEHLLICEQCRANLTNTEQYIKAMALGAARLRRESENRTGIARFFEIFRLDQFRLPATAWAAAAVAVCAVLFLSTTNLRRSEPNLAPFSATLIAFRSAALPVPANHPLRLRLDTSGLTLPPMVHMTLVDSDGSMIEEQTAPPAPFVDFQTSRPLTAGAYYVRILTAGSSKPAREFALDVR